jgi:hypothetical protein
VAWRTKENGGIAETWQAGVRVMSGEPLHAGDTVELDTSMPAGVYRLKTSGMLRIPVSPPGTPEVLELDDGRPMPPGRVWPQYWFRAPETAGDMTIAFQNRPLFRQAVRDIRLWRPDGSEAWRHVRFSRDEPGPDTILANVNVAAENTGRLWRITLPGPQAVPFTVRSAAKPVFALSRERWFDPGAE